MGTKWQKMVPHGYSLVGVKNAIHIDLGCGNLPRNPLGAERVIGVDLSTDASFEVRLGALDYKQVHPGLPLPFDSEQVESVSAFDFLEHLPRSDRSPVGDYINPFINVMNEIHRILKPGGVFIALTPCYPSPAAFTDPTHVNFISETTHLYFSGPNFAKVKNYGFLGEFRIIEAAWSNWDGNLWQSYAIQTAEIKISRKIKIINSLGKVFRNFKFKLRKALLGHSGETHFLWVLQKPEAVTRKLDS
jgi:SAM-dependent methyltransferase